MPRRRLGFVKRAPCSRATRILWLLDRVRGTPRHTSSEVRTIFQSILKLLSITSDRTDSQLRSMMNLLEKLPSWMEWTAQDDKFMGSALSQFFERCGTPPEPTTLSDVKQYLPQQDWKEKEDVYTTHLMKLSGDRSLLRETDFTLGDREWHSAYLVWLHKDMSPTDPLAHIQDEHGVWLRDDAVRRRLQEGDIVDISQRVVRKKQRESHFQVKPEAETSALHRSDPMLTREWDFEY